MRTLLSRGAESSQGGPQEEEEARKRAAEEEEREKRAGEGKSGTGVSVTVQGQGLWAKRKWGKALGKKRESDAVKGEASTDATTGASEGLVSGASGETAAGREGQGQPPKKPMGGLAAMLIQAAKVAQEGPPASKEASQDSVGDASSGQGKDERAKRIAALFLGGLIDRGDSKEDEEEDEGDEHGDASAPKGMPARVGVASEEAPNVFDHTKPSPAIDVWMRRHDVEPERMLAAGFRHTTVGGVHQKYRPPLEGGRGTVRVREGFVPME